MSRDSHKTVSQYLVGHQHQMATINPFSLPMRPVSQWDDTRDRTSEQLHESAMYQLGLERGPSTSTYGAGPKKMHVTSATASDPFEAVHRKWEERGWLIQKHERRLKDSNKLLSKMWRRLDPYGRVLELLNTNSTVRRHAEQRAEPAFSESYSMQDLFYQLAAYDYLHATDPGFGLPPSTSLADPALNEKRLNSLASTVKIQSGLLQEKNDTIEKLRTQLEHQHRSHLQQLSAHQKDKDDAIDRLEKQLKKVNVKLSRLHNASKSLPKPKPIAPVAKVSVVKLPETAFGGVPENHASLTFEGFSEHNTLNPARLMMLTAANPPAECDASMVDDFDVGPRSSGANCAPLGPVKKCHGSALQSSRASQASTPMSSHWSSNGEASKRMEYVGSKRPVSFLDYDDPEEKPEENPKDSKRIKSGVLTPPLPEDLVMASTEESGGGVPIKYEIDLEIGEIEEAGGPGGSKKYAYEDLDEMITQAQKAQNGAVR